jgi:hypothetical protein
MIIATYVKATNDQGGNARCGWTIHEVTSDAAHGEWVSYLGFVDQGSAGNTGPRTALRREYPDAIEVQGLDITDDQYYRLEDDRVN